MRPMAEKILVIVGDGGESYETWFAVHRFQEAGYETRVAAPSKKRLNLVMHDFEPGWQMWASQISTHPDFAHGSNVELVRVLNEGEIEVRFCERGVGETMSSGTGSSASAAASIHEGKTRSRVRVHAPGGTQTVEWERELLLYGPATILCRGEFFV